MFASFGRTTPSEHMVKMLRDSEPNAVKRMIKFLEDYEKCTSVQRDQVFVPVNEESIISLFVGAVAVFKKHHSKSKAVSVKDVRESLRLLDLLRERRPRALGNCWDVIKVHLEAFLDEALPVEIKTAAFCLLFSIVDNSVLSEQKGSDSSIEELFCKAFHWPHSYRLRVEPSQPCEFLPRTNQFTENWDTFCILFEKFISLILCESKSNHETQWWFFIKDKLLTRIPLSLNDRVAGSPMMCPVPVAASLLEFFHFCLEGKKIAGILTTSRDLEIALSVFNVVMMNVQSTAEKYTNARSKCVFLLERWVCIPAPQSGHFRPQPFQDDMDRWLLHVIRCIVMFFHSWKDVKNLKNEQDLDNAFKCITLIELISRLNVNADVWKSLFRSILDISNSYLGVTEEQRRGDATHPPDKVLSCTITDGIFALLLRRVPSPELWEELRHRERGISGFYHFHTTIDSWTRVLLVIARRLVMHMNPSKPMGSPRLPDYIRDHDYLSLRMGGRSAPKSLSQASPWQHRVDSSFDATQSLFDQQLQHFFSLGSPWFPPSAWNKNTDCCRAWDKLVSLIPPKKKFDRDFSITIQAFDSICEWFLDAGVLPSTCLQYFSSWLFAAFEHAGDQVVSSAHGSGPSHVEVTLSVAIRLFRRIIMHQNYPISHEDPLMIPFLSALHNMAFKCDSVLIQSEAFEVLTRLLHVIPHAVSFLVPVALASKLFTKKYLQLLTPHQQGILCRFIASVVHTPGYFGVTTPSLQDEMCKNLLSAFHEMLQHFQDCEMFSQLMWSCWLSLLDASTSSNSSFCGNILLELSEAILHFSQSNAHLVVTLEVIRAAAFLIPSFIDHQQHHINQMLIKLSQGLSSKINQSSLSKMAEQHKDEYYCSVQNFISTIREWLTYCIFRVPPDILDQVYEALIHCIFDGTNIYKQLQTAMEVQPADWSEIDRIIASRNANKAARSELSISAEVCLCSLSSFMPTLPALSLSQDSCDYASSLCKAHPHVSLMMGKSRILTFVEDQSAWGKVWVVARDTTGTRLWSAHSITGDAESTSTSAPVAGLISKAKSSSVSGEDDHSLSSGAVLTSKKEDHKDQGNIEIVAGESSSFRDDLSISRESAFRESSVSREIVSCQNDDEVLSGVHLLNDEDFVRPSGKLALFQIDPHTSRVEMLRHLIDFLDECIAPSSVALDGSQASSCRLIQSRNEEHARLSNKLKTVLQEEQARAAQRKAAASPPFLVASPPPVADKRLWKFQFTRQILSSFMFVSPFSVTLTARILPVDDENQLLEQFDKIPSRENLTVMLSLPSAGESHDADEFLNSLLVNATRISNSEFFLSSPDRDIRFVVSSGLPPLPAGRWSSPAHVQILWHPRDAVCFDPSSSTIFASCHCIILQPIGANLIRVEDVLVADGDTAPIAAVKSKLPFLRGSIINVNVIEPVVLACAVLLTTHGDVTKSVFSYGPPAPSFLKRRFDILYAASQICGASQSFFDVADIIQSQ